jgi:hypothetical protein
LKQDCKTLKIQYTMLFTNVKNFKTPYIKDFLKSFYIFYGTVHDIPYSFEIV